MKEENWKWLQRLWLFLVEFQRWMAPPPKLSCVLCNRTNTTSTFVEVFSYSCVWTAWWWLLELCDEDVWVCFGLVSGFPFFLKVACVDTCWVIPSYFRFLWFLLSIFILFYLFIEGPISSAWLISFIMKYLLVAIHFITLLFNWNNM